MSQFQGGQSPVNIQGIVGQVGTGGYAGSNYYCSMCGQWIAYYSQHLCPGRQTYWPTYEPQKSCTCSAAVYEAVRLATEMGKLRAEIEALKKQLDEKK